MKINATTQNRYKPQSKQLSFKQNIFFINNENDYYKILNTLPDAFLVQAKECNMDEAAYMESQAISNPVNNCVCSPIINIKTRLLNMFHLDPENYSENIFNLNNVKKRIYKEAEDLKGNSQTKLEGLILGGESSQNAGYNDNLLLTEIKNVHANISEKIGMEYSVIAGRKNGTISTSIASDARTGTHILHINDGLPAILRKVFINSIQDLNNAFETVIISPNTKLFFNPDMNFLKKMLC